ncbi:MAG: hypothetical protein ACTS6A_00540 [Candidatus Hodgkinia cicadicola]
MTNAMSRYQASSEAFVWTKVAWDNIQINSGLRRSHISLKDIPNSC